MPLLLLLIVGCWAGGPPGPEARTPESPTPASPSASASTHGPTATHGTTATHGSTASSAMALLGARIHPVSGPVIEDGVLLVEAGRIQAVGARGEVEVPAGHEVRDLAGRVIVPGLVCTHSHVGGIGGADGSGPIQPDVRVYDSINVRDSGFKRALAGGLTTLNIMPGSGHLMSGQTIYVKLREAERIEDMFYRWSDGEPMGGMKMANGTNSLRGNPWPGTRGPWLGAPGWGPWLMAQGLWLGILAGNLWPLAGTFQRNAMLFRWNARILRRSLSEIQGFRAGVQLLSVESSL